ncbi:DUF72 domain-containing protein [Polaromonas sp. AER18D-145]|uniref:DUF72 domain-containing protein n=1 Tax=Polaromonas sp. AER18D-145 TaxID=1977060 RepID=UPI000BBBD18B|nr:DUF72 domain-containing protein [Polaromonas sp. AER18D-145]
MAAVVRIGCAGWRLPRDSWPQFPDTGTHLQRYARRFNAVEINSSFYRSHQPATYERWAAAVPAGFRFSVKLPKTITHEKRLQGCAPLLHSFLAEAACLGERLGCLLVQLPPSLALDTRAASGFLHTLRKQNTGPVALEPRHASWFEPPADALLRSFEVARVLADPVLFEAGARPGGWPGVVYLRLHGSPRTYYSPYDHALLDRLAARLVLEAAAADTVWCIFDNTASGAATENALYTRRAVQGPGT